MRDRHAGAAKVPECAKPPDRIADRFDPPREVHTVEAEFSKRGIVDRRRQGMFDRIADNAAKLSLDVDFHHDDNLIMAIPHSR
jgi:hypothetical protein